MLKVFPANSLMLLSPSLVTSLTASLLLVLSCFFKELRFPQGLIHAILLARMLSDHFSYVNSYLPFWSQLKLHLLQELTSYSMYLPTILSQTFSSSLHGTGLYSHYLLTYLTTICNLFIYLFIFSLAPQPKCRVYEGRDYVFSSPTPNQPSHNA